MAGFRMTPVTFSGRNRVRDAKEGQRQLKLQLAQLVEMIKEEARSWPENMRFFENKCKFPRKPFFLNAG